MLGSDDVLDKSVVDTVDGVVNVVVLVSLFAIVVARVSLVLISLTEPAPDTTTARRATRGERS